MIPIIIVDYSTMERTQQYIKDCSRRIISKQKLLFIIVETGQEEDWTSTCLWEVLKKKDLSQTIDDRISQLNIYQINEIQVLFIQLKENYGFAVANNIGVKVAVTYLGDVKSDSFMIFSNNDIQFPDQIDLSVYDKIFIKDRKIAVIGPRIVGIDGKDQSPHKYISLTNRWLYHFIMWPIDSIFDKLNRFNDILVNADNCYPYRIIGAFMVAKLDSFVEAGMFDESTFLYCEEKILAERLKKCGYKIYYDTTYSVVHEGGATTCKSFDNRQKQKLQFESELYYYKEYMEESHILMKITLLFSYIYSIKKAICNQIRNGVKGLFTRSYKNLNIKDKENKYSGGGGH